MNQELPQPAPEQTELPLPFPEFTGDMPLLPARMVNEYQYCPRLSYLEWVQGEWADSADTVEGRHKHKRVDGAAGELPGPGAQETEERIHARSVTLSSARLGLIAKIDLVEGSGDALTPVDYKRGKRPHVPKGAYDPERVQLCIQEMLRASRRFASEWNAAHGSSASSFSQRPAPPSICPTGGCGTALISGPEC